MYRRLSINYQASAQDPFVLAAVGLTTVVTGLIAIAGPVRRVLHVDPRALTDRDSFGLRCNALARSCENDGYDDGHSRDFS